MGTVLVIANGVIEDKEWLRLYLGKGTAVIAADGGGNHLAALGVRPDVVVGDLDSLDWQQWEPWEKAGTKMVVHPAEKNETDLELALLYAVQNYAGEIKVLGALGGRLDQMMANIFLLAHPALTGRQVTLVEPTQQAWLVRGKTEVTGKKGDRVSLIPLGGDVKIGRTIGLKWKLKDETLRLGPARGISNVMLSETAVVEIDDGIVLCVHLAGSD